MFHFVRFCLHRRRILQVGRSYFRPLPCNLKRNNGQVTVFHDCASCFYAHGDIPVLRVYLVKCYKARVVYLVCYRALLVFDRASAFRWPPAHVGQLWRERKDAMFRVSSFGDRQDLRQERISVRLGEVANVLGVHLSQRFET